MKKTLLATAIAGAMVYGATAAQAATVYDQDGTQVDVYGRLVMGLTSGGVEDEGVKSSGSEFEDFGSRFGFRARNQVNADLSVFANAEFRFDASDRNSDPITNNRQTFVGVQSQQLGRLWVGNFNSVYYNAIGAVFDVPENEGWSTFGSVDNSSHGNALAYSTPVLEGFQVHLQVKHYSGNGEEQGDGDNSSTTSSQAVVSYTWQDLYLALGFDENRDYNRVDGPGHSAGDGPGSRLANAGRHSGEALWGGVVQYQFTPAFSARLGYETSSSNDSRLSEQMEAGEDGKPFQYLGRDIVSVGATFDYGTGEIYGQYSYVSWDDNEATGDISSSNQWMLGANYRFSRPMYVFAEVYDSDFDSDNSISDLNDDLLYTVGVRYDF
ncbi:porin [Billgrantia desiderata]|uniref:porin n=1 Tax=Billgrantia desiderata TaxID=52021 RepID=UPI00089E39FA|nr:porin [Halomonas desiderata]SEF62208.1 Outer membrane protein (porin) [Halomonas desiderata]